MCCCDVAGAGYGQPLALIGRCCREPRNTLYSCCCRERGVQRGDEVIPHYLHAIHTLRASTDSSQQQYSLTHNCAKSCVWPYAEGMALGSLHQECGFCCTSSLSAPSGGPPLGVISGSCRCCSPIVFALLPMATGQFTRIWEFLSLPTTSHL